ncbi:hypothetical protein [uncultured Aquimarina sp.]|uniref:hypothetical protein n=1 Tax=uncultured Aquimarina sp. TaxID=575652 RepID=UPI0026061401|nr:hypothetical protein [uncultured Aquimarina sp.]
MNLPKFHIYKLIKTEKSVSELADSLKKFDCKKIELENNKILIFGKAFYDFTCDLNISEVKLTVKPKKVILILVLFFLTIWTIGFIYENGILFGLLSSFLFIVFGGFVHKKMMELNLEEISELIKK